jgi:hypothetical protein
MTLRLVQAWLLALAVLMSGCAATVQRDGPAAPLQVPSTSTQRVVLSVVGSDEMRASKGWDDLVQEWKNSMEWAASNAKIAYSFHDGGDKPAVQPATWVKVNVKDFRFVSTAKRWMIGVFSGNAFIDSDVSFVDLQEGRDLGVRNYASTSRFIQGVFAAMSERQLEAISTEIVKDVTGR